MGYDDNECLICYLKGHGNNPTGTEGHVCLDCLLNHGTNGHVTGRVLSALNGARVFCTVTSCDVCHTEGMVEQLGICVRVCSGCQGKSEPSSDDDSY